LKTENSRKLSDEDFAALSVAVREVLFVAKRMPGACVLMSALVKYRLESLTKTPADLVAGILSVNEVPVFGSAGLRVDGSTFSASNPSWDGHCWVQFGEYIVDTSIGRTIESGKVPPLLAQHMRKTFGEVCRPQIATDAAMRKNGLIYEPLHILTAKEADPITRGALHVLVPQEPEQN
jgi:hypothetical protein